MRCNINTLASDVSACPTSEVFLRTVARDPPSHRGINGLWGVIPVAACFASLKSEDRYSTVPVEVEWRRGLVINSSFLRRDNKG